MSDYLIALDCHVKLLLSSWEKNPEYYSKVKVWMVHIEDKRTYTIDMQNISALFVIDFMIKTGVDKYLRFTLHDNFGDKEFLWLTVD
jgi:hypothetical protein